MMTVGSRPDAHLYVVGARGSGKSTLLNRFIQPDRVSSTDPEPEVHKCRLPLKPVILSSIGRRAEANRWP